MAIARKVREHVRKYFNPEDFNPRAFRDMLMLGLLGLLLAELLVYILLQHSADLGELPHYITDAVIIGISLLELIVVPLISWLGPRRRSVLVGWTVAALVCTVPLYAVPDPDTTADPGLCTSAVPLTRQATGISAKAAVRLSMLLISGLVCALARAVYISHGLAYLDEHNPSDNLLMNVGIFLLHRVMVYLLGNVLRTVTRDKPWLQISIIVFKYLMTLLRLYRYPEAAPVVEKERRSDRGLFCSMGRVLGNRVAVLQILAMSLLAAAWWGFGMHETAFVLLAGYMYTTPVMPKFDRKSAVASTARMCFLAALFYVFMTVTLSCNRSGIGGLDEVKYSQPACGENCGCDRPWMEFTPVCVPEQMTTYFSPCHAGCATADTVNSVGVYSNCTCAPGGRVFIGACDDGSCASAHSLHQMFYVVVALTSTPIAAEQPPLTDELPGSSRTCVVASQSRKTKAANQEPYVPIPVKRPRLTDELPGPSGTCVVAPQHRKTKAVNQEPATAFAWQTTVVLESVDKRDVAVAVGLTSGIVSLFTFAGAHGFYMGISYFTCAFTRGSKCLLQNDLFTSWVGYSSAVLAGLSFILTIISCIILRKQKEPKEEDLSL